VLAAVGRSVAALLGDVVHYVADLGTEPTVNQP
jgi:hypothetical protein